MREAAGEALWRFSLAFYARPDAAAALIALQDRAGRNVNLTLFALWLGATQGRRLSDADIAAAEAAIAAFDTQVVVPLRALRRGLDPAGDRDLAAARRRIAGVEIDCERLILRRLAAGLFLESGANDDDPLAVAAANLRLYLGDAADGEEANRLRQTLAALMRRS
jgi:uncharacterized protein (TIGR02444 family)